MQNGIDEKLIEDICNYITKLARKIVELSREKPTFLLHFPRGASPIVDGIIAAAKIISKKSKHPFKVINIPISLEEALSKQDYEFLYKILEDRIDTIPKDSNVIYVDEAISGRNSLAITEKLYKILNRKNCKLFVALLVSKGGTLFINSARRFNRLKKYKKNLHIEWKFFREIPWSDMPRLLGESWGLKHIFPKRAIEKIVKGRLTTKELRRWERKFYELYEGYLLQLGYRPPKVIPPEHLYYKERANLAAKALVESARELRLNEKLGIEKHGSSVKIAERWISFPDPTIFLLSGHYVHAIRKIPKRKGERLREYLKPDVGTLLRFLHLAKEAKKLRRTIRRTVGKILQRKRLK